MLKKILKNELGRLQNINVKIYANEAFIYCGKCDNNTLKVLEKLSELYLNRLRKRLSTITDQHEIWSLKKQIANFKSFANRTVQNMYDGILPEEYPCKIIQISGNETGQYWTVKEFSKKLCYYQSLC